MRRCRDCDRVNYDNSGYRCKECLAHRRTRSIRRGSVVKWIDAHSDWHKGVVLKLLPPNDFSRAYGRQALVAFYHRGEEYQKEVGVGDMRLLGRVKHVPKVERVTFPPHPDAVRDHETMRDLRRQGQGAHYNPSLPTNAVYERPLPGDEREMVAAVHRRRSRRRR